MANFQIQTRQDLFDLFRLKFMDKKSPIFIRSVPIKCSPVFREAISVCLQELLGIEHMENLTPVENLKFGQEVEEWYKNVPGYWKSSAVNRTYKFFETHHAVFLSRELHLGVNDNEVHSFDQFCQFA